MNAETQSCISASLIYMTYVEHVSYGKYVYSKSVIIKHILYCKHVSSYTDIYDILDTLHSLNYFNLALLLSSN